MTKKISEETKEMPQSQNTAFPRHQGTNVEQISRTQTPHMKLQSHKQRRNATEEQPWNGQ